MPVEFKLPDLGEGIHEGEIIEVLVRVGDRVEDGQPILIVETDKATAEIPAPVNGTVQDIRVKSGQVVHVGDVLMVFAQEGEAESPPAPSPKEAPEEKKEARPPAEKQKAAERQAERTEEVAPRAEAKREPSEPEATPAPPPSEEGPVPATPSTRRLARELGVELRQVTPSGPAGRVTADDVRAFAEAGKKKGVPSEPAREEKPKKPAPAEPAAAGEADKVGPVERIPLRSVRRATAKHVAQAWSEIPHVTHMDVADITELEQFRQKYKTKVEEKGGALSLTVFMLKAVVSALKNYPRFNSSLDTGTDEIILKRYYNISVAVDTERGLIVPVIRDVDRKSLMELAIELKQVAEKARQGKTQAEELAGGSFTITNLGPLGGTSFNPIINYPQAAILGMAQARMQPVVTGEDNQIVPRLIMPLVITFDHRVLDGADAARFLSAIIESLREPENLLMVL